MQQRVTRMPIRMSRASDQRGAPQPRRRQRGGQRSRDTFPPRDTSTAPPTGLPTELQRAVVEAGRACERSGHMTHTLSMNPYKTKLVVQRHTSRVSRAWATAPPPPAANAGIFFH